MPRGRFDSDVRAMGDADYSRFFSGVRLLSTFMSAA
jgi:hypothetical protein